MRFDKRPSKKSKSGYTWRVTLEYKDKFGVKHRHTKSGFSTKKEAAAYGTQAEEDLGSGLNPDARYKTLDQIFEEWLSLTTVSPNTQTTYTSAYRRHIQPVMGTARIQDLGYVELQTFFNNLADLGRSNVQTVKKTLRQLGSLAIKAGYIKAWPLEQVELKGKEIHRDNNTQYLQNNDFIQLVDLLTDGTFEGSARAMFLYLGYYLGLRIAEACALQWDDFSPDYSSVRVHSQLLYSGRKRADFEISETMKTDRSRSVLPVPAPLAAVLREWREENPYPILICTECGAFFHPSVLRAYIKKAASQIGIDFHPHMLRHTYITNLVLAGADPKTAAELARHSDPKITLQIYTEISQERKEDVVRMAFSPETPELLA